MLGIITGWGRGWKSWRERCDCCCPRGEQMDLLGGEKEAGGFPGVFGHARRFRHDVATSIFAETTTVGWLSRHR